MISNPMHGIVRTLGKWWPPWKNLEEGLHQRRMEGKDGYSEVDMAVECTVLRMMSKASGSKKKRRTVMATKRWVAKDRMQDKQ